MNTTRTAIARTGWSFEPRLVKGRTYELKKVYFHNGEHHAVLADDEGTFEVPDVFLNHLPQKGDE